jgi:hypothetical protein
MVLYIDKLKGGVTSCYGRRHFVLELKVGSTKLEVGCGLDKECIWGAGNIPWDRRDQCGAAT